VNDGESSCPAVELRGVCKRFGSRVILDKVDLCVARGEVLVLVGPSGSGKSTLLKLVSGIETPDEGQVWLAGKECTHHPPYRRAVHTVFQSYALFPHLNVAGNIAFPLSVAGRPRNECEALVRTALGWVKLEQHAHRRIETLSGGERQRVALARALVDSPACVLLDEPLSALDPNLRAETLELLQTIHGRLATTFLFITHDREEALKLGHRIGVLNLGRLEQIGTPEEVYQRPTTAFVASFLGRINWLCGQLDGQGPTARLVIAGQSLPIQNHGHAPTGRVKVGVRPEEVQISADGWLAAQITGRQFLGDCVIVRLKLADGTSLIADQRAPLCDAPVGSQVRIHWPDGAAHLFPADGQEAA
jgi:ABC-type Fe3+/spermidine/putrescine transport system ATPase subunit